MAGIHSITTSKTSEAQGPNSVKLDLETRCAVTDTLGVIKAVGDSIVLIVTNRNEVPLPDTLNALGHLLIDKAEETADYLGLSLEQVLEPEM